MTIYLMRHFEPHEDCQGKYIGHTDPVLSTAGKAAAKKTGDKIRERGLIFDLVFCSDLKRTRETLDGIGIGMRGTYHPELRELYFGDAEGKTFDEIKPDYEITAQNLSTWLDSIHGSEKVADFEKRLIGFFENEILTKSGNSVLIVAHLGVLYALGAYLQNLDMGQMHKHYMQYGQMMEFEKVEKGWKLVTMDRLAS